MMDMLRAALSSGPLLLVAMSGSCGLPVIVDSMTAALSCMLSLLLLTCMHMV